MDKRRLPFSSKTKPSPTLQRVAERLLRRPQLGRTPRHSVEVHYIGIPDMSIDWAMGPCPPPPLNIGVSRGNTDAASTSHATDDKFSPMRTKHNVLLLEVRPDISLRMRSEQGCLQHSMRQGPNFQNCQARIAKLTLLQIKMEVEKSPCQDYHPVYRTL